jgi:hypothetical protein
MTLEERNTIPGAAFPDYDEVLKTLDPTLRARIEALRAAGRNEPHINLYDQGLCGPNTETV